MPEASLLEKAGEFRFMVHLLNLFFVNMNEMVLCFKIVLVKEKTFLIFEFEAEQFAKILMSMQQFT